METWQKLKIPQSGLVAHYRSNNAGLLMPDITAYRNDTTLVGAYDRRKHNKGFATTFPGTSSQTNSASPAKSYMDIPGTTINKITILHWVYMTASTESYNCVIEKGSASDVYTTLIKSNLLPSYYIGGTVQRAIDGTGTAITLNTWYHIGFTYDGSTLIAYRNGVRDASSSGSITWSSTLATEVLKIAWSRYGAGRYFQGSIDDVTIYNRALTGNEVSKIYTLTKH